MRISRCIQHVANLLCLQKYIFFWYSVCILILFNYISYNWYDCQEMRSRLINNIKEHARKKKYFIIGIGELKKYV